MILPKGQAFRSMSENDEETLFFQNTRQNAPLQTKKVVMTTVPKTFRRKAETFSLAVRKC